MLAARQGLELASGGNGKSIPKQGCPCFKMLFSGSQEMNT